MAGTPEKTIFALANMINNDKQYKKMKRTILRRAFVQALFATIGLTLFAAEEAWLWPIEGQRAGDGILYRPQDNIEKELNFGGLFIAAPEGTNVLCPADAVVTSCDYTYYTSLTNSVGWGPADKTYDEFIAEQKEYFRRKGWDIRYLTLTVGLKIGDKTLWIHGLRRDNVLPSGTKVGRGDVLGTVAWAYHAIPEPHIDLSVSVRSKADDPMTPFGLRTTFRRPEPKPRKLHLTRDEAEADYRQLAGSVKEIYPSLDDLMTEEEYDAFVEEQLARIPADGIALKDFAALMKDYNAAIHDSHFYISCPVPADPKERSRGLRYAFPSLFFGQVATGDSLGTMACVVLMADSTHAAYVGRHIARIDGRPATELISITRRNSTGYDAGVTSVGDYNACYWNAIDYGLELGPQPVGKTVVYEFADGERIELPMVPGYTPKDYPTAKWARHQQVNRRQRGPFEVRRENDSVLYIGISTFSLSQLDTDSVVDAIHAAERDSVPFLIFDVRNNFGGDAGVQARITRALLGRTPDRPHTGYQRVNAHLFKSGTLNWPEGDTIFGSNFKPIEGRKGLYQMEEEEDNATLSTIDSLGYNGRLYVLIDSRSASASAFLAGAVKRNDRGYIVGRETMSAYHCETCIKFANIYLPNSEFQASIPMVRVVIDSGSSERLPARRGVIPDCDIPMTEAEFHYDGDYILDRTLQLIADGTYLLNGQWKKENYQLSIINCAEGAIVFALAAIALVAAFLFLRRRAKDRKTSPY